jgi:Tfp pilus assembly protein PilO
MSGRDRTVAMVVAVLAVLAAGWILVVSPERKKASTLGAEVSSAQSQLSSAESELSNARSAQAQYATAYTAIVGLGKAVPASQEVPSLIYQLEHVSNSKKVDFSSIVTTTSGSGSSSPAAAAASSAGFASMPFTFVFTGTYFDLEHLFEGLNRFTVRKPNGTLVVSGRLLTIQSVKLTPVQPGGGSGKATGELTGTITATAYVLPATQGLTGGASPSAPAGGSAPSSSGSSPTAPAVIQVTP